MSFAFAAALIAQAAGATAPAPPPNPCAAPVYQAFDFWVGDWDVYPNIKDPAKAPLIARSRIEKLYGGCAIRENWMPVQGAGGGSLNAPDPATGRWHQYWLDSTGGRVEFDGGPVAGAMVLTGFWPGVAGPGKDGLIRMSYTRIDADTVRQYGQISTDHGMTWTDNFDFIYRRAKPAS
ncbi:MAG: hypothetical protein ABL914_07620 [Novosphingobium sp.]|uniref:hypothetical protein n=1 Tax=Novosphingobium sp. TaxID=1874826 RepID=UPI0032BCFB18